MKYVVRRDMFQKKIGKASFKCGANMDMYTLVILCICNVIVNNLFEGKFEKIRCHPKIKSDKQGHNFYTYEANMKLNNGSITLILQKIGAM